MTHPMLALQTALVTALKADPALQALLGDGVFDAPPLGRAPPYLVIARHDLAPRNADAAAGSEHRLLVHAWAGEPSRKDVLALAGRVAAIALSAPLDGAELIVTHRRHVRTETAIDAASGQARAAVTLQMFSEPA